MKELNKVGVGNCSFIVLVSLNPNKLTLKTRAPPSLSKLSRIAYVIRGLG